MVYEIVLGALKGDPMYQQHLSWLLSKPAFWLVMAKWALLAVGVIWILRILVKARNWKALGAFALMLLSASWMAFGLFHQTKLGFENGQGPALAWRGLALVTDIIAICVIVMLWKKFRNRKRQKPGGAL